MKTVLMTALFIAVSMGFSKVIKTSEETGNSYIVSTMDVLNVACADQASCELKQEFNQSTKAFTNSIKQMMDATVDMIVSIIAYAGIVVTQTLASIVFD